MCTCQLTLSTNKLPFDWRVDKGFHTFRCGKCPECRAMMQKEWQARAVAEWMRVRRLGGCCYMYTLTYRNEDIPILNGEYTFSRRDVQLFLKRLRKSLYNLFGTYKLLKYVVTSEYGGNTRRPHYHCLLYFDISLDYVTVRSLLDDAWRLGWVAPSRQNHGCVRNAAAVLYTMKYITKDQEFIRKSIDKHGNEFIHPIIDTRYSTSHFNSFAPFHLQSQGFGAYLSTLLTEQNLWNGSISLDSPHGPRNYPIPLYNIRKSLYTTEKTINGNVRYVLNDKGVNLALTMFPRRKEEKRIQYTSLQNLPISVYFNNPILNEYGILTQSDFADAVGEVTDDFLDYVLVYRGLAVNSYCWIPGEPLRTLENYLRGVEFPFDRADEIPIYLTPQISEYEHKLHLYSLASAQLSYQKYCERTMAENAKQRILYDTEHKKFDEQPLMSFEEYYTAPTKIDNLHFSQLDARKNHPETINTKRKSVYDRCLNEKPRTAHS